mmetsp:Transcript_86281/g.186432  ORF Transcript_86281/g.186432 Transcript_86281/m.186432 type:complete len:296 (+) Transcript_86281:6285-7172(+)
MTWPTRSGGSSSGNVRRRIAERLLTVPKTSAKLAPLTSTAPSLDPTTIAAPTCRDVRRPRRLGAGNGVRRKRHSRPLGVSPSPSAARPTLRCLLHVGRRTGSLRGPLSPSQHTASNPSCGMASSAWWAARASSKCSSTRPSGSSSTTSAAETVLRLSKSVASRRASPIGVTRRDVSPGVHACGAQPPPAPSCLPSSPRTPSSRAGVTWTPASAATRHSRGQTYLPSQDPRVASWPRKMPSNSHWPPGLRKSKTSFRISSAQAGVGDCNEGRELGVPRGICLPSSSPCAKWHRSPR